MQNREAVKRPVSIMSFVLAALGILMLLLAGAEVARRPDNVYGLFEALGLAVAFFAGAALLMGVNGVVWELRRLRAAVEDTASNQTAPPSAEPPRQMD